MDFLDLLIQEEKQENNFSFTSIFHYQRHHKMVIYCVAIFFLFYYTRINKGIMRRLFIVLQPLFLFCHTHINITNILKQFACVHQKIVIHFPNLNLTLTVRQNLVPTVYILFRFQVQLCQYSCKTWYVTPIYPQPPKALSSYFIWHSRT